LATTRTARLNIKIMKFPYIQCFYIPYVPHYTKIHYFLTNLSSAGDLRESLNKYLNIMRNKFNLNPVWEINQSCCIHWQSSCNGIRKYTAVRNVRSSHLTTVSRFGWQLMDLSTLCPMFYTRTVHVEFVVDKRVTGSGLFPSTSFFSCEHIAARAATGIGSRKN